jgi:hypothetical protein
VTKKEAQTVDKYLRNVERTMTEALDATTIDDVTKAQDLTMTDWSIEGARRIAEASTANRRPGPKQIDDADALAEAEQLVASGEVKNVTEARGRAAKRMKGGGTIKSKVRRLERRK